MKLSRRHFLTRAAGLSVAALTLTLPVTEEYNASGKGRVHRDTIMAHGRHDDHVDARATAPCNCRGMIHMCSSLT